MTVSDIDFLQAFLAPLGIEEFRNDFWPDNVFVIHGPLERLPTPLSNPELTHIKGLFSRYTGRVLFGKGSKGPRSVLTQNVNPYDLYAMGLTLYLPDVETIIPGAAVFLRLLEKSLGLSAGTARITIWASPSADGAACHFDAEEVFSIQLKGVKRFYVAEKKALVSPVGMQFGPDITPIPDHYLQMRDGFPKPDDFEFTEIEMKPGSILFLPRGVWHRTEAEQNSMAISIILSPVSAADCLVRELRTLLLQEPAWRRPLYGTSNPAYRDNGTLERVEDLLKALPQVISSIRAEDLTPQDESARLANIQSKTRFQRIPHTYIVVDTSQGKHKVRIQVDSQDIRPDRVDSKTGMEVSTRYSQVLNYLDTFAAAFSVGDMIAKFEGISLQEHQMVLAYLAQSKGLQLLWFRELSSGSSKVATPLKDNA
jgi:ribosomal protein L16 Arg81 hydroxylase